MAAPQPILGGVSAVVVDAIVRDRRGNPVTDLTKADFELFEDGVRQEIAELTVVGAGNPSARSMDDRSVPAAGGTARPRSTPAFTAIVFDRLAPEVRDQAARAAHALVDTLREDDFAGVFLIDHSLRILQTYTTDRAALRRALDVVAGRRCRGCHADAADEPHAPGAGDGRLLR